MSTVDDLLLFRAVDESERRSLAAQLLDAGVGGRGWRQGGGTDLWELYEAGFGPDEGPVAVVATSEPDRGHRVRLLAAAVVPSRRGQGIGTCLLDELADALRARGVLHLSAAVPSDNGAAMAILQRAGFRLSGVERVTAVTSGYCVVCFDLEL